MQKNNPRLLLIETSSPVCSVAYAQGNMLQAVMEDTEGLKHAAKAPLFAQELIQQYGAPEAVVVSAGPGSYTGLRIGVSLAKGICYGLGIPLISVDTLQALTDGLLNEHSFSPETLLVPLLDARRMEVYYAVFDNNGHRISPSAAMIVTNHSFSAELSALKQLVFFGSGAQKSVDVLNNANVKKIDFEMLSASFLLKTALQKYHDRQFEDVAYFEPNYIKDFHFTPPKKNVLERIRQQKRN